MAVPIEVRLAVNALLLPYGEKYTPPAPEKVEKPLGYVTWSGAVAYTGLSKSTLVRAIAKGKLKPPHKITDAKNGSALFALADLDDFVKSH